MSSYVRKLLGDNEKLVFMTRKHFVVIGRAMVYGLFAIVVIGAGAVFASTMIGPPGLLLGVLELLPLAQLAVIIIRWSNEEYIVTNRRVMKVEGFMNKHVFDSSLEKVSDVELDQSFLGRMFNYGDVEILTASDIGANKFTRIANPIAFKHYMLNEKEALGALHEFGSLEQRVVNGQAQGKQDVPGLIAELDELRKKGIINDAEFESKKAELLKRM
jgi:uncharacterized membrane protein YdbT with pleckstrin-like domain